MGALVAEADAEGCAGGDAVLVVVVVVVVVVGDTTGVAAGGGTRTGGGAVGAVCAVVAALTGTGTGTGTGVGAGCATAAGTVLPGRPRFVITTPATTPSRPTRPMMSAPANTRVGDDLGFGGSRPRGHALIDAPSIVRIDGPVGGPSPGAIPRGVLGGIAGER